MTPRRAVSALLAVLAATMLVTGSFGFTSVSAERGVSINVVESENAYVGVTVCKKSNGEGSENGNAANWMKVTVTNQFSDSFAVEAISGYESGSSSRVKGPTGESIVPGESETFEFKARNDDDLTVTVSDGLDASVTVDVSEEKCSNSGVSTNGNQTDGQNATGTPTPTPEPTDTPTATATPEPTETPTETPTPK